MLRKIYSHGGKLGIQPSRCVLPWIGQLIPLQNVLAGKIINCDSKFQRCEPAVMRKGEKTQFDDLNIDGLRRGWMLVAWRGRCSHGGQWELLNRTRILQHQPCSVKGAFGSVSTVISIVTMNPDRWRTSALLLL